MLCWLPACSILPQKTDLCPAWVKKDLICPDSTQNVPLATGALKPIGQSISVLRQDINHNCYPGLVVCKDGKAVQDATSNDLFDQINTSPVSPHVD